MKIKVLYWSGTTKTFEDVDDNILLKDFVKLAELDGGRVWTIKFMEK